MHVVVYFVVLDGIVNGVAVDGNSVGALWASLAALVLLGLGVAVRHGVRFLYDCRPSERLFGVQGLLHSGSERFIRIPREL